MLKLVDIKKNYVISSDETVHALKGVSVNFRRNEFVAILGQSGCGKTTLLNIIGGLDRYTSGDLIIEGKSTKNYKDGDWDTYRNHSIGFIFQSYNLIGHINILKNVELALTLSGIDKKERKARAEHALEIVGLKGQGKKKPNQLSGGQMQRVAIARALINNPEIVLADEPTGALDSETSVQIMELLKEVAKDRLVIMVTHNPELAKKYATRIVTMKDGALVDDSDPYQGETSEELLKAKEKRVVLLDSKGKKKKTSMSFKTALSLSFNNLMTKKARTFLISFAGSIGIIGITLILSLSNGFNNYIYSVQSDSMSTYPLAIYDNQSSANMMDMMLGGGKVEHALDKFPDEKEIHENSSMTEMMSKYMSRKITDTSAFVKYIQQPEVKKQLDRYVTDIQFDYPQSINIYALKDFNKQEINKPVRLSPVGSGWSDSYVYDANTYHPYNKDEEFTKEMQNIYDTLLYNGSFAQLPVVANAINMVGGNPFGALLKNNTVINDQFDVLQGRMPEEVNEVVVRVNEYNEIPDLFLYGMGVKDISYMISQYMYGQMVGYISPPKPVPHNEIPKYNETFDEVMGLEFAIVNNTQLYEKVVDDTLPLKFKYNRIYYPTSDPYAEVNQKFVDIIKNSFKLKVVGIVRQKPSATMTSFTGAIGYHPDLYEFLMRQNSNPTVEPFVHYQVLADQLKPENQAYDVLTGQKFISGPKQNSINDNMSRFGFVNFTKPSAIYIYPKNFGAKSEIINIIDQYNASLEAYEYDEKSIIVVDNVGLMLDSVQTIVDSVSYVLIAFVSISLLVSSIMIGIITYVSVLERTKEIGVLRSIGARKKDISRVFNAETMIIGLVAGLLGVGIASLVNIPIMLIINALTDVHILVIVPWLGAIVLPLISIAMTMVAGLIPSSIASKRDPVIALRTE